MSHVPEHKMVMIELRVGGRLGRPKADGRRGDPVFRWEVPETLRDYTDFTDLPVPSHVGAVYLYFGDELARSWVTKEHEGALVRHTELSDMEATIAEGRNELRGVELQQQLARAGLETLQGQVAHLTDERLALRQDLAALRSQLDVDRARANQEVANLNEWVSANKSRALQEMQSFVQACEAQVTAAANSAAQNATTIGQLADGVVGREGKVAQLAAARQVASQNEAMETAAGTAEMLTTLRALVRAASLGQAGPSVGDKMIDLIREVLTGSIGQTAVDFVKTKMDAPAPAPAAAVTEGG